jgi:ribosomal protein S18 acetylase RimI-like enzyme
MIEIRTIEAKETYPIRKEELRKNVSLSHKMEGDEEPDTLHLGIFIEGELAGIVSLMKASIPTFQDEPQYQIRGMAMASCHQRKGLGKRLLKEAENRMKAKGVEFIWCNARVIALDFYLKMGYEIYGPVFELPEIGPHYKMYKKL